VRTHSTILYGTHAVPAAFLDPVHTPSACLTLTGCPRVAQVVRASRNLPLALMKGEYERILRRRLAVVGGSPDDGALHEMLSSFRWARARLVSHSMQRAADGLLWAEDDPVMAGSHCWQYVAHRRYVSNLIAARHIL